MQKGNVSMAKKIPALFIFFSFLIANNVFSSDNPSIIQKRGNGKVVLVQYSNGQWQMLVEAKPYFIKGVVYEPVKIGRRLTESNMWMNYDFNQNGKPDTAYDAWVDKNNNNVQDKDEPVIGDFQLLKEMGCNTIRIYHHVNIKKEVLRDLFRRFGIRVILGNLFGAYTWGSGASWEKGTDYTDPLQRQNMLEDLRKMVLEYKDEPYVLFWMLGNENDVAGSKENSTLNNTNARLYPEVYAKFVNEAAKLIHKLDPNHPVGVSNAMLRLMKYYNQYSPEIDIIGLNAYTGAYGFGTLWNRVKVDFDRPVVITEYGAGCYNGIKRKMR
jgi:Beta-galactosidase/beta-glucuronidase